MKSPASRIRFEPRPRLLPLLLAGVLGTLILPAADLTPAPPASPTPPAPPGGAPEAAADLEAQSRVNRVHQEVTRARDAAARAADAVRRQYGLAQFSFNGPSSTRTLIVPRGDATEEQLADVQEQLTIMSRILTKAADPEAGGRGGFRFNLAGFGFGGGSDLDALYLDGYGAVFLVDVDYPLVEPPKGGEKKATVHGDKDLTWEKTRRELAGAPGEDEELPGDDVDGEPGKSFDADRVAALRKRLVESFRHAANLKMLKEGAERVTFVVSGPVTGGRVVHLGGGTKATGNIAGYVKDTKGIKVVDMRSNKARTGQQLTLTARKGDIDSFAAGRMTLDEFARKVTSGTLDRIQTARP